LQRNDNYFEEFRHSLRNELSQAAQRRENKYRRTISTTRYSKTPI
jgi:hypothetical protein